jgi:hypothetical protein
VPGSGGVLGGGGAGSSGAAALTVQAFDARKAPAGRSTTNSCDFESCAWGRWGVNAHEVMHVVMQKKDPVWA